MDKEYSCGSVIVNKGRIAIVFQKKTQTWCLPKGHVHDEETEEETARREIYEETGLKNVELVKRLGSYERHTKADPEKRKQLTFFLFTTDEEVLSPVNEENPEAKWVNIDEVTAYLGYEEDKNFFLSIQNELN